MVLLDRLRLKYHHYEFIEAEREGALLEKGDALAAKIVAAKTIEGQRAEIAKLKHELNHEKQKSGELEITWKKWEKETM